MLCGSGTGEDHCVVGGFGGEGERVCEGNRVQGPFEIFVLLENLTPHNQRDCVYLEDEMRCFVASCFVVFFSLPFLFVVVVVVVVGLLLLLLLSFTHSKKNTQTHTHLV